jgi:hypothetical protein
VVFCCLLCLCRRRSARCGTDAATYPRIPSALGSGCRGRCWWEPDNSREVRWMSGFSSKSVRYVRVYSCNYNKQRIVCIPYGGVAKSTILYRSRTRYGSQPTSAARPRVRDLPVFDEWNMFSVRSCEVHCWWRAVLRFRTSVATVAPGSEYRHH